VTTNLSRRLERLETQMIPEPEQTVVLHLQSVRPDGTTSEGPQFVVSFSAKGPGWRDSWRWKGNRNNYR